MKAMVSGMFDHRRNPVPGPDAMSPEGLLQARHQAPTVRPSHRLAQLCSSALNRMAGSRRYRVSRFLGEVQFRIREKTGRQAWRAILDERIALVPRPQ